MFLPSVLFTIACIAEYDVELLCCSLRYGLRRVSMVKLVPLWNFQILVSILVLLLWWVLIFAISLNCQIKRCKNIFSNSIAFTWQLAYELFTDKDLNSGQAFDWAIIVCLYLNENKKSLTFVCMPATTIGVYLGCFHYNWKWVFLNGTKMKLIDYAIHVFANFRIFKPQIFVCR